MSPLTETALFVAQVPVTATGGDGVNQRELMAWRMRFSNSVPRSSPIAGEPKRRSTVSAAKNAMAEFPNLRVLRPDLAFYEYGVSIRFWSYLYYTDDDHLTEAGLRARGYFSKAPLRRRL